jgi:beta-lactamase superfamily II metal-dependent hydrolase
MLFTGDARGDFILEGLGDAGLLENEVYCDVDILKIPHHGSDNNVTEEFFERVRARHYVFSGNGEHGNPERETMKMLIEARKRTQALQRKKFSIWLTYPVESIDARREEEWNKDHEKGNKTRNWDAAEDSLKTFFETVKESRLSFEVVDDQKPVTVSL